ncbi:MAG: M48 family metallopeptidase [Chloroflexota bacterium]
MQTECISRRLFLLACVCSSAAFLLGCEEGDIRKAAVKLVPQEELREMGIETWRRIRSQTRPSRDAALQKKLQTIGGRMVKASSASGGDWEFVVFRGNQINAFVVPGNKVGFFEGMFAAARNDSQIAAVLGHEIGHINAQHPAERIAAAFAKQVGLTIVLAALRAGDVQYANEIAGLLGAGLEYGVILPYSRRQEQEADRLGLEYMARAGYAPGEAVTFWQNMMAINSDRPRPLPFLSTHPSDEERIAALREVVQQIAAR